MALSKKFCAKYAKVTGRTQVAIELVRYITIGGKWLQYPPCSKIQSGELPLQLAANSSCRLAVEVLEQPTQSFVTDHFTIAWNPMRSRLCYTIRVQ